MAKVLIVDDDPDFVETTRLVLEAHGHEALMAANGDEALDKIRSAPPDVVLLDVMMRSILEGVHVSQELWADPALRSIPIVMVSSIADTQHAEMFPVGEELNIDGFLTKPIKAETLLKEIARLTTRRK